MRFKELPIGSKFVFEGEYGGLGLARGPWVKLSARCYEHLHEYRYGRIQVGSINAAGMSWPVPGRES